MRWTLRTQTLIRCRRPGTGNQIRKPEFETCPRRGAKPLASRASIRQWNSLDVVDHDFIERCFSLLQLQSELLLEGIEQRESGRVDGLVVFVGQCPGHADVVNGGESGLVDDGKFEIVHGDPMRKSLRQFAPSSSVNGGRFPVSQIWDLIILDSHKPMLSRVTLTALVYGSAPKGLPAAAFGSDSKGRSLGTAGTNPPARARASLSPDAGPRVPPT